MWYAGERKFVNNLIALYARVVESADSLASGASALHGRAGSSPASRTKKKKPRNH